MPSNKYLRRRVTTFPKACTISTGEEVSNGTERFLSRSTLPSAFALFLGINGIPSSFE